MHCKFVAKCAGKEDFSKVTNKSDRTFLLCVTKSVYKELYEMYPKSKAIITKRALFRRVVFNDHLAQLEEFLAQKKEQMKKIALRNIRSKHKV